MRRLGRLVVIGLLGILALATRAWAADPLAQWVDDVAVCTSAPGSLTVAVIGFDSGQTVLSRVQADEVRHAIEARLQASGRIRLAPTSDVVRIKALREQTTGLSAQEAEDHIRKAFQGDASVFLVSPTRTGDKAVFRLQAIAKAVNCKVTSEPLEVLIHVGPGLSDIDQVMQKAIGNLTELAPEAKTVEVCPFVSQSGYSTCSRALTDRLLLALDAEARSPNRVLRQRSLDIRKASGGQCSGDADIIARGTFDYDRDNHSWMSLEFSRKGNVIAPTGRTRIAIDGLGCDPTLRPFLDHVAETAKLDRAQLDVLAAAAPFEKGRRLDIKIEAKAELRLYCWVLAPDETAFVVLPVRGNESQSVVAAGNNRSYPTGFGLADIVLSETFENLFDCFGVNSELPTALHERWMAAAPSMAGDAKLLARQEVLDLMEQMRQTPGVTEAVTRIIVR